MARQQILVPPGVPATVGREAAHRLGPGGRSLPTTTIFLTNRECPYRCLMCDLWTNTLDATVPKGAIAAQIRDALINLSGTRHPARTNERESLSSPLLARSAARRGAGG